MMPNLRLRLRTRFSPITLADRARDTGQWEVAARYYRRALDRNPCNSPIWVQYGHVKKEAGQLGHAEEAYRKAIELDPNAADSYAQLGHVLRMQGRGDEAADTYRKALALDAALCAALEPPDLVMPAALHPPQHYIKTMHGTYLCIDKATGQVQHRSEIDEHSVPLLYFELEPESKFGFLTPAGLPDEFVCGNVVGLAGILPLKRTQFAADTVGFQQQAHSTFLCAEGPPSTNVVFDRDDAHEWETFSLHRVRWKPLTERYALAAASISSLGPSLSLLPYADALISHHSSGQDQLLGLCLERLTFDDFVMLLDVIRARLREHPPSGCLLRRLLELRAVSSSDNPFVPESLLEPDNSESVFWIGRILPDLMAWRRNRDRFLGPDNHVRLGTELNFLQGLEHGISMEAPSRLYNFLARYGTKPTRGICAVTTARNEGVYLLEWLAYHRSIGIETFFVYSNDNDDGSDALLKRLSEAGAIYWLENMIDPETAAQKKAFSHALNALPQVLDYQWATFIDLDEFIVIDPDRFATLPDYLAWQQKEPVDAIGFNWVWIGSSGLDKWSPDFVRSRFTQRYIGVTSTQFWGGPDRHIKSIFRPQRFLGCQPHYPITDRRVPVAMRDTSGYPHLNYYGGEQPAFSLHPKAEAAWVNHYFFKSAEEFVWKRSRNGGDTTLPHLLTPAWLRAFASQHWSADVIQDDRILRCGKAFQEYYDAMLSINGVTEIAKEVNVAFRKKLDKIKTHLVSQLIVNCEDELVHRFLDSLIN
jgi:hypothetical protein